MIYLITGSAGFVGSHLADKLISLGHRVIGIDNFDNFYAKNIKKHNILSAIKNPNFIFIEADITHQNELFDVFSKYNFDCVIHLAAKAGVRPSIKYPSEYFKVNVDGTVSILEAMKQFGVKKLINASSSSVYGNNPKVPFSETDSVDYPISPYAASKKAGELVCHTYHHLYGFDIFCLRFFTVYGPRQRPDLAIHKFTEKIINSQPIDVYGDGSTARDYTYIDDIIQGICLAIEKVKGYEIINIGESKTISLSKMISVIEEKLNKKAIVNRLPMQPGDVNLTNADISKAKQILGYNPIWKFEKRIEENLCMD